MSTAALPVHEGIPVHDGLGATVGAPRVLPLLEERRTRVRRHRTGVWVLDAAVVATAATATATLHPGLGWGPTLLTALATTVAWGGALLLLRLATSDHGLGRRLDLLSILHSAAIAIATIAIADKATGWPILAPMLTWTTPTAVAGLLALHAFRYLTSIRRTTPWALAPRALIVGDVCGIESVASALTSGPSPLHNIIGVATPDGAGDELTVDGRTYRVVGASADIADLAREWGIETVIIAGGSDDPALLRELSWSLEGVATDLILATRLSDVARSRIAFHRRHGLALTQVSLPRFDRTSMRRKRALDVIVALLALIPIAALTPFIAAAIRVDSPGPVLFRQRRIGRDGREFDILKFRTMVTTAESDRAALEAANEGAGPLFKLKRDPRVTRVGSILRRYSLDELPQFWNVLKGEMSVVGPRPPLPSEVRGYDRAAVRRLFVQPGITGLWQVSGRSDLSWEQSVRLDLHYVENWSLTTDLSIILRTAMVLLRPQGAY